MVIQVVIKAKWTYFIRVSQYEQNWSIRKLNVTQLQLLHKAIFNICLHMSMRGVVFPLNLI